MLHHRTTHESEWFSFYVLQLGSSCTNRPDKTEHHPIGWCSAFPVRRVLLLCEVLLVRFDHLLHHLAAYGTGLTAGEIAVIALLEVYADLLWRFFTLKHTLFCT